MQCANLRRMSAGADLNLYHAMFDSTDFFFNFRGLFKTFELRLLTVIDWPNNCIFLRRQFLINWRRQLSGQKFSVHTVCFFLSTVHCRQNLNQNAKMNYFFIIIRSLFILITENFCPDNCRRQLIKNWRCKKMQLK